MYLHKLISRIGIQACDVQLKKALQDLFGPKIAIYFFLDLYLGLPRPEKAPSPPERTSSSSQHEIS
jgi:hypothetical protein